MTFSNSYGYHADGNRVKGAVNGVTTSSVAGLCEWKAGATSKYYDGGAIRRSGYGSNNGISYVLGDQLGSTSVIVSQAGAAQATNYYYPFGGNRGGTAFSDLTTKRFTGQYHESGLPGGEGLSYYNARWYDPQLGRFASADTIVPRPGDPQAFNRYAYSRNSPTVRIDPSGHGDYCNPALYSCGGSGSTNPVNHLPHNATPTQRRHARYISARLNPAKNMTKWTVKNLGTNSKSKIVAYIRSLNEQANRMLALGEEGQAATAKAQAYFLWYVLVRNQGRWDYKHAMRFVFGESYVLGGEWFEYSTIGNIHFGYVGRAAGFTPAELYAGAGVAQWNDDNNTRAKGKPLEGTRSPSSFGDTDDDHAAVKFGAALFDTYGADVDESKFRSLMTSYSGAMAKMAGASPAGSQRDGSLEYDNSFFDGPFSPPANDS